MPHQDPISDMLTRLRNALGTKKQEIVLPYSRLKAGLARVLAAQNWLASWEAVEIEGKKFLKLSLKYDESGSPAITGLLRISKPGQRIYAKSSEIPRVRFGQGSTIVSTSRGLMTDREAVKQRVGGEVICQIW